jgi:hypothetical protein
MENEFRNAVKNYDNFANVSLENFSALPEADTAIYFGEIKSIDEANFKAAIMALRKKFNS